MCDVMGPENGGNYKIQKSVILWNNKLKFGILTCTGV